MATNENHAEAVTRQGSSPPAHSSSPSAPSKLPPARIVEWKPLQAGAMIGLVTVTLPSGMTIHACPVFRQVGRRWVATPGRPRLRNGVVVKGADGKPCYDPIVSFADRERQDAFSALVLAALDEHLGGDR